MSPSFSTSPSSLPSEPPTPFPTYSTDDQCTIFGGADSPPFSDCPDASSPFCCVSGTGTKNLVCGNGITTCQPGPASQNSCILAQKPCDTATQDCCKERNGAVDPFICIPKGSPCPPNPSGPSPSPVAPEVTESPTTMSPTISPSISDSPTMYGQLFDAAAAVYNAQNFDSTSAINTTYEGYTGHGYVNMGNNIDSWVEFEFNVTNAGPCEFEIRYRTGFARGNPSSVSLNGNYIGSAPFENTDEWQYDKVGLAGLYLIQNGLGDVSYGLCQGDCDNDDDCIGEDLICEKRDADEPVPGCLGEAEDTKDYCRPTNTTVPTYSCQAGLNTVRIDATINDGGPLIDSLKYCEGRCPTDSPSTRPSTVPSISQEPTDAPSISIQPSISSAPSIYYKYTTEGNTFCECNLCSNNGEQNVQGPEPTLSNTVIQFFAFGDTPYDKGSNSCYHEGIWYSDCPSELGYDCANISDGPNFPNNW